MIRVLVVDDDFMVAELHSTLVARVPGFEVAGVAHSGAETLSLACDLEPDLVLLDLYLPDVNGLEVLRRLREATVTSAPGGGPDVLVITAARDAASVRAARHGGAVQYVVKPFEGRLLTERLERYAHESREFERLTTPGQDEVDHFFGATGASGTGGASGGASGATGPSVVPGTPGASGGATAAKVAVAPGAAASTTLPKGLSEQTSALVDGTLAACRESAGLSASECAQRSGLSRVSARRYLEHFVATGVARVTLRYGTTGRPERRYHPV